MGKKHKRLIVRVTFTGGGYYDVAISSAAADKQGIAWDIYTENFLDNLYDMHGAVSQQILYDSERS